MTPPQSSHDLGSTMATTNTTSPGNPPSPQPRFTRQHSNREHTVAYADLMVSPDEDWRNLPNAAERRKIQNRLAQRAYRRSLRERNEEIKRLRKKVEELEEKGAQNELQTPPTEPDSNTAPSLTVSAATSTYADTVHSSASVTSASDWMGDYLGVWPHTPLSDHGSLTGSSNAMDTFGTDFNMDAPAADHMLQPISEPAGMDPSGTTAETVLPAAVVSPFAQFGKSGSTNTSNNGGHNMFSFHQPLTLGTGDFNLCTHRQQQRLSPAATPRLSPCGSSVHGATRHDTFHSYPTPPPSHYCGCSSSPSPSSASSVSNEHQHGRCVVRPLDAESLYLQGLVVEPCDGGDGVTIRLPGSGVGDGKATVVAFMIQRDGTAGNKNNGNNNTGH
ncbi:hypothetical protein VTJ49DRAFT_5552 [Mycothermus thermophilus]|uniref:BZIP domain-containing protein n=1 Tax=Humicola insolens TaxID=85995 RepID=A0ABR3V2X4_HUMIN